MQLSKNGEVVSEYFPSYVGINIVVAIDSSKSNTAIIVGDLTGNILDDYEISGAGSNIDVYQLCWDTRKALSTLFHDAKINKVGIENIITKKENGGKGLDIHQSRAKITAVFDNLIFFFQDRHNIMPVLVNNQEWKAATLPEEYRKRSHKKGSKDFFRDIGSYWGNRKDDVTDAVMIYKYLMLKNKFAVKYDLTETTPNHNKYQWCIFPESITFSMTTKEFVIQNTDSIEHNLDSIANRIEINEVGIVKVEVSKLTIDLIYSDKLKYTNNITYKRNEQYVTLAVMREAD